MPECMLTTATGWVPVGSAPLPPLPPSSYLESTEPMTMSPAISHMAKTRNGREEKRRGEVEDGVSTSSYQP